MCAAFAPAWLVSKIESADKTDMEKTPHAERTPTISLPPVPSISQHGRHDMDKAAIMLDYQHQPGSCAKKNQHEELAWSRLHV